jgi:hypothetical protein
MIPFYRRSDTPDLDDVTGLPDPVSPPFDREYVEHLHQAYGHMAKCVGRLERALDLLGSEPIDDEPLVGSGDEDEVGPITGYTDLRRALMMRQYARSLQGRPWRPTCEVSCDSLTPTNSAGSLAAVMPMALALPGYRRSLQWMTARVPCGSSYRMVASIAWVTGLRSAVGSSAYIAAIR